jgi:hypothetical protein
MTLVEDPGILTLPSFSNSQQASELLKGPSVSETPSVTVDSTLTELNPKDSVVSQFELEEHPIDVLRSIKVGIIGAGLAGITAGVLLPAKLPGLDLRIYDKNADVVRQVDDGCSDLTLISYIGRHLVNQLSFAWFTPILTLLTGLKTHTRVFVVTFLHTPINLDSLPTLSGLKSSLKAPR